MLRDALDLKRELGGVEQQDDGSYLSLPSISAHPQNRGYRDWVILIELVRDAWLSLQKIDSAQTTQIARSWFAVPYATFKRLALFAAAYDNSISPTEWVGWLMMDDARWLWSVETKREMFRLLVMRGADLTPEAKDQLEAAILLGPPRTMYRHDLDTDDWVNLVERSVWRHLAKLKSSGAALGKAAAKRFAELSALHPLLSLIEDQRDEFSFWMGGTGDSGFEYLRETKTSRSKRERAERWRDALQKWTNGNRVLRSWQLAARMVERQTEKFLEEIAHGITRWLQSVSKVLDYREQLFLVLCERLLSLPHQDGVLNEEPVTQAINHPVGHIAEALLNVWFKQEPNDNSHLPPELEPIFSKLCDTSEAQFRNARVIFASRLIALFRLDQPWTESHLFPLLDWQVNATEARAA